MSQVFYVAIYLGVPFPLLFFIIYHTFHPSITT